MRWAFRLTLILILAGLGYLGTAIYSVLTIAQAVQKGDDTHIIARTDVPSVRHAVVDQLMDAYLDFQNQKRRLSPFQRTALNAYGTAVADSLVGQIFTPENVSALLRFGTAKASDGTTQIENFPPLASIASVGLPKILGRIRPIKPVEFFVQLGTPEDDAGISLHFDGRSWKISSMRLPKFAIKKLVERLPSP